MIENLFSLIWLSIIFLGIIWIGVFIKENKETIKISLAITTLLIIIWYFIYLKLFV